MSAGGNVSSQEAQRECCTRNASAYGNKTRTIVTHGWCFGEAGCTRWTHLLSASVLSLWLREVLSLILIHTYKKPHS